MNLIFYDRSATPAASPTEALLTIERKGIFSFAIGAVDSLRLKPEQHVVLAQDTETNNWYLLLAPLPNQQPFTLRPRDGKGKRALLFCSQPQARAYYQAHGLLDEKSVRATVGLEPVQHEQLVLYPLVPQHASKGPVSVQPVAISAEPVREMAESAHENPESVPAAEPAPAAAEVVEQPVTASQPAGKYSAEQDAALLDMANSPSDLAREWGMSAAALHTRRSYLKKKNGEAPAAVAPASTPAVPTLIYTPATGESERVNKTFGLLARAQELGAYWHEREISNTTPGELAEILNLIRHVPTSKQSLEMSMVLTRAETEQQHRLTAAGKGGARG